MWNAFGGNEHFRKGIPTCRAESCTLLTMCVDSTTPHTKIARGLKGGNCASHTLCEVETPKIRRDSPNLIFNIKWEDSHHVMEEALTYTHWANYVTGSNLSLMLVDELFGTPGILRSNRNCPYCAFIL